MAAFLLLWVDPGFSRPITHCAFLCSVSVPTSGLAELLLINAANFLEEGFTSIGLCAIKTSAAGRSFSGNAIFASAEAQGHPGIQETSR